MNKKFSILIKSGKNYVPIMVKVPNQTKEETYIDGNEIKTRTVVISYKDTQYIANDTTELKSKYAELIKIYPINSIQMIQLLETSVVVGDIAE